MFRKTAIAGYVLLAFGAAALAWVYNEQRAQRLQQEDRQTRLRNELNQLDELVGDEIDVSSLDTLTYADDNGLSWEETQEIEERRGLVLIAGGVLTHSSAPDRAFLCNVTDPGRPGLRLVHLPAERPRCYFTVSSNGSPSFS